MLLILAIVILLFTPVLMTSIRFLQPKFAYQYLLAFLSSLILWIIVLISRPDNPQDILLLNWQPESLFPYSPTLLLDHYSWSFAFAISTLLLAVILTSTARLSLSNWRSWAGSLILSGLGILAVLAGNPLTLLIAWAALDLCECIILMILAQGGRVRLRIVYGISIRTVGIGLLLIAMLLSWSAGETLTFTSIPAQAALLLFAAAALRLGILPLHPPFILETQLRRGLGTTLRLVPVGASLILITRTASIGFNERLVPLLLALAVFVALYGAAAWIAASDELRGRAFWILGIASLAVGASIRAQPEASLAWGLACLLSGAFIFLASPRNQLISRLLYMGVLAISGLPFTPLWNGWLTYGMLQREGSLIALFTDALFSFGFFSIHILMIFGYLRHISHIVDDPPIIERWIWALYLPGLAVLIIAHFVLGFFSLPDLNSLVLAGWLSGVIVSVISLILWQRARNRLRTFDFVDSSLTRLEPVLHLSWIYHPLRSIYLLMGRFITLISTILEGEGGLLWTMLIVLLLFSLSRF